MNRIYQDKVTVGEILTQIETRLLMQFGLKRHGKHSELWKCDCLTPFL